MLDFIQYIGNVNKNYEKNPLTTNTLYNIKYATRGVLRGGGQREIAPLPENFFPCKCSLPNKISKGEGLG